MKYIIMAGGKGTRLFPLSRENYPKQFLKLFSDKTLLEETILRLNYTAKSEILIVTNKEFKFHVIDILNKIFEKKDKNLSFYRFFNKEDIHNKIKILAEPEGKNTAPAITYSISFLDQDDIVAVLPSDHYIGNLGIFHKRMKKAFEIAKEGSFVTFGIVPEYPETGYGYIEITEKFNITENTENKDIATGKNTFDNLDEKVVFNVVKFKEKPDLKTAEKYIEDKRFFWNSGMFVFKVSTFIEEIRKYNKHIFEGYERLKEIRKNKKIDFNELKDIYSNFPSISIDYALCEHSKIIKLVIGDFEWTDIGSFDALFDYLKRYDKRLFINANQFFKTQTKEHIIDINNYDDYDNNNELNCKTSNNLIIGTDKIYSIIGLKDIVMIDTEDVTVVTKKGYSKNVKKLIPEVENINKVNANFHITVKRPWGIYSNIYEKEDGFKIKRISVNPGQKLSLQLHHKRAEHWVVVQGEGKVQLDDQFRKVKKGDHIFIQVEQKHRIECTSSIPLIFIEVQIGDYLGEDDIERFEDIYGRA